MIQAQEEKQHRWTEEEKHLLTLCTCKKEIRAFADKCHMRYAQAYGQYKYLHCWGSSALPTFDYTKIQPLRALFTRCPVCGGTTTVNANAYCHSCCTQWHALTLKPLSWVDSNGNIQNLHAPDRIE
jgi:hypothetical protein